MDVMKQRWLDLINFTNCFFFGSLWKVKNSLWKESFRGFVSKDDNGHHPALCLGVKNVKSLCQTVSMLLGSHSNKKGFLVKNFSCDKPGEVSLFKLRPCFFCIASGVDHNRKIERNDFKPCLDQEEIVNLKNYLRGKGVKFNE